MSNTPNDPMDQTRRLNPVDRHTGRPQRSGGESQSNSEPTPYQMNPQQQQFAGQPPQQQQFQQQAPPAQCPVCWQFIPPGDHHMHNGQQYPQGQGQQMPMQQNPQNSFAQQHGMPGGQQPMQPQAPQQQPQQSQAPLWKRMLTRAGGIPGQILTGASRGGIAFIAFILFLNGAIRLMNMGDNTIEALNNSPASYFVDTSAAEGVLDPLNSYVIIAGFVILFLPTLFLLFKMAPVAIASYIAALVLLPLAYQGVATSEYGSEFIVPLFNANPFSLYGYNSISE